MIRTLFAFGAFALAAGAFAQGKPAAPDPDARPAVSMSPDDRPAVGTAAPAGAAKPGAAAAASGKGGGGRDTSGSTIVGERESPIGLYITPWRDAYAEQDIDRPARLLQVDLSPVDRVVFSRQVEYYDALSQASMAKKAPPTPAAPEAPPPAAP